MIGLDHLHQQAGDKLGDSFGWQLYRANRLPIGVVRNTNKAPLCLQLTHYPSIQKEAGQR